MKRVCAWCHTDLGTVDSERHSEDAVTHGMCDACSEYIFSQMGTSLQKFLNGLNAPILVVNSEGCVMTANEKACVILGKELKDIEGYMGGEVIECAFARLPGGCGNTVHCKSCTIRNSVTETFATGNSLLKVPAYRDIETVTGIRTFCFLISTEKVRDVVLLRIDEIGDSATY